MLIVKFEHLEINNKNKRITEKSYPRDVITSRRHINKNRYKTRKPCKINIKWIKINVPHSKYHF